LYGTFANLSDIFGTPEDYPPEMVQHAEAELREMHEIIEHWGDGARLSKLFAPSMGEIQQRFFGTFARAAASPRMARALIETVLQIDVRDVLASVRVPTLVLHVDDDRAVPVEAGQRLADGIPGASFVTFPGLDHAVWMGNPEAIVDEIERFITGSVQNAETDRVLATVMFTDIVDSTRRAAQVGDRAWREVLERHDAIVERVVVERGGRVVKHIGDGAMAAFDGPAKAVRCAETLHRDVVELGIQLRAGIHTGECEAIGEDLGGLAVHIGARVSALAGAGEIAVSSTVKELVVGSGIQFADTGEHELKGVPGSWRIYTLGEHRTPQPELDGAASYMRRSDRIAVSLARRMPRTMRLGAHLASRGPSGLWS